MTLLAAADAAISAGFPLMAGLAAARIDCRPRAVERVQALQKALRRRGKRGNRRLLRPTRTGQGCHHPDRHYKNLQQNHKPISQTLNSGPLLISLAAKEKLALRILSTFSGGSLRISPLFYTWARPTRSKCSRKTGNAAFCSAKLKEIPRIAGFLARRSCRLATVPRHGISPR
ncbi:hypothetical protein [Thioclava sp. GXIMD4215]|uniref:hypothetical protein n=1 Tax=Thioclava sp. GXIMD4215 TaxID=3131928 RepID=UPI0032541D7F